MSHFSISRIVVSLLAETPHEILYYFRFGIPSIIPHRISHYMRYRMKAWFDLTLMALTFFLSIIWNIEVGVVVSVIISLLMVVHRSSRTRMTILV